MSVETAEAAYDPRAAGRGARRPAAHPAAARPPPRAPARGVASSSACATCATCSPRRRSFSFDEAVEGADRLTEAVTLFALLELYKAGEAAWEQEVPFGADHGAGERPRERHGGMGELARIVEALLFLSPEPVPVERARRRLRGLARARWWRRWRACASTTPRATAEWCCARWPAASRSPPTRSPSAPRAGCWPGPRTPPLTQAQAECLAIVAYLQPVSRPEIARIRGVASESAVGTLLERGLVEESGRSRFGAIDVPHHRAVRAAVRPLRPRRAARSRRVSTPRPEEEGELRERLVRAGEQRAQG